MKNRMRLCSIVLSAGIVASSIVPAFAAQQNEGFVPEISSFNHKSGFISGKLTEKSKLSPEKIVEKNYNKAFLPDTEKKLSKESKKDKKFKKDKQFKNSKGRTVVKTTQTYNGVPVYGTDQNFHVNDEGVIECIVGSTVEDIENKLASSQSSIKNSEQDVLSAVEKHLGFKPEYIGNPQFELVLYPVKGKYVYSYKVSISYNKPSYGIYTYYVDANSLSVINLFSQIAASEQPAVGSGIGQFGTVKQNLKMVYDDNGTYYLDNTVENVWTKNYTDPFQARYSEPDNFFNSGTSSNYQQDAVDAHHNMTNVLKFFNDTFGRNGNDNNGSRFNLFIDESGTECNAYGSTNYARFPVGHGDAGRSLACCLDVVGHEFTHGMLFSEGLTDYSINYSETGSLHEGLADVFGMICEYYIPSEGSFDWTNGEDSGTIIRDCANPDIDDYDDYITNKSGSHSGGGVITKAAYLIAEGGTHNNKTVTGIGYTKLANIFYNAIDDGYLCNNTNFTQFAAIVANAAELAYGAGSQEVQTVNDAFAAVRLLPDAPQNFVMTGLNGQTVQFSWTGTSGDTYGIYRRGIGNNLVKLCETTGSTCTVQTLYGNCDFYVAKVDSNGNRISGYSNAVTVSAYANALENFTMTGMDGSSVSFSWDGISDGYLYILYRRHTGSSEDYTLAGMAMNAYCTINTIPGKYDYYVAKIDYDFTRFTNYSNPVTVEYYLTAPQNLIIAQQVLSSLQLSWAGTSGASYAVYCKSTGSTGTPVKVWGTTYTSCSVPVPNGSYDFYVAQVDSDGYRISDFSNPVTAQYYAAPQNLVITQQALTIARLGWDSIPGATYAIYSKLTGSTDPLEKVLETTNTSGLVSFLDGRRDFYVAQIDSNGDRISEYSNVVTVGP